MDLQPNALAQLATILHLVFNAQTRWVACGREAIAKTATFLAHHPNAQTILLNAPLRRARHCKHVLLAPLSRVVCGEARAILARLGAWE